MELTNKIVEGFVGGQLEVQNGQENYVYRGEISTARLEGAGDFLTLVVDFRWYAKLTEDFEWEVAEPNTYRISLMIYEVSTTDEDVYVFSSWVTGEFTVVFPPGGSTLDPSKVRGLTLA